MQINTTPASGEKERENEMIEMIRALRATTKRTEKENILAKYKNNDVVRTLLLTALNPFYVFGIADVESLTSDGSSTTIGAHGLFKFNDLLYDLAQRNYTGNQAREAVRTFVRKYDAESQNLLLCLLKKDLEAGVSTKTINKVFGDLIPEYELQLATDVKDHWDKIQYPVLVEEKYDGFRMTIAKLDGKIIMASRNGMEKKFPKFEKIIKEHLNDGECIDGEVIDPDGFQSVMTQANRKYGIDDSKLVFVAFDMFHYDTIRKGKFKMRLEERRNILRTILRKVEGKDIRLSKAVTCSSKVDVQEFFDQCIENGLEGVIIKGVDSHYKCGRNTNWLKYKPSDTVDAVVIDLVEGKGQLKGTLGAVTVKLPNGNLTNVSGFKMTQRHDIWGNPQKYLDKTIEIRYDSYTKDGRLRFGRYLKVRGDK